MSKVCNFCGNKHFRNKKTQYIYKRNEQLLLVNGVPCEECEYCGEQYFTAEALKRIEKEFDEIYSAGKKTKREVRLPVEEFVDILR